MLFNFAALNRGLISQMTTARVKLSVRKKNTMFYQCYTRLTFLFPLQLSSHFLADPFSIFAPKTQDRCRVQSSTKERSDGVRTTGYQAG